MTAPSPLRSVHAALAEAISYWSDFTPRRVEVSATIFTERAVCLGLIPPGRRSANGSCALFPSADGWIAANLPRPDDLDLIPALLETAEEADPWTQLEEAARHLPGILLVDRARLLGLAIAMVGEQQQPHVMPDLPGTASPYPHRPSVLDLSALWAGPLCGAILAEAGCAVTKVETRSRPDTTAARSPDFDARLNGAKDRVTLNPQAASDMARLEEMIATADIIITSARRRGLTSLGIADALSTAPGCWIEITAHPDPARIGFGDDCAAAAGLVRWDGRAPHFLGDALADPLTGLAAAAVALQALAKRSGGHHLLALSAVARSAALG